MIETILEFLFLKTKKKKTCYTYIGKNREYRRSQPRRDLILLKPVEAKKPSALSKYFENAESLLGNNYRTIV